MMNSKFKLIILVGLLGQVLGQNFVDISPYPTIFESTNLPTDENGAFIPRQMASVGNGHVATTIFTDTVYMNGLYNGDRGESHRARIPSGNNIRAMLPLPITDSSFSLDVSKGVFFERYNMTGGAQVEHRIFAHRYFTKVIVNQIKVSTNVNEAVTLELRNYAGSPSLDLTTVETGEFGSLLGAIFTCAETKQKEDSRYQDEIPKVCTINTAVPESITFEEDSSTTYTFVTAYGFDLNSIESDFTAVVNLIVNGHHEILYRTHVEAWQNVWENGVIEVEGNLQLAKAVYGCLYYILSSLPVTSARTNSGNEQFYGLSPGGLAYGSLLMDYQGHSFWDTETWMYPPILYLYPEAAKEILNYRLAVTQAARDHAEATGFRGARFPWESGVTGREVTPNCCPETRDLQVHISSDISFAIRQYISMTRDLTWLKERQGNYVTNGCGLLKDIAEFWTTRSVFNSTTGFYDILGVMPPDEDNHGVNNNGYTNIGAGYAIFYAKYAECLCDSSGDQSIPDEWVELAKSLKLLYDEEKDYHPEYEGYEFGTSIKQADVVLMGFPQLYDMDPSTRKNDLLIYANVTREDGPAMTWAMHTIGFLELDELEEAAAMFNQSYQWYLREPFKIWTESKPPNLGAINFITGMGGFLQSILSGYGGLRVHPEKITITKPRILPDSDKLIIKGIKYLGNVINVQITSVNITLSLEKNNAQFPLQIASNGGPFFDFVEAVTFSTQVGELSIEIATSTQTNCQLPHDKIGTPHAASKNEHSLKLPETYNEAYANRKSNLNQDLLSSVHYSCVRPGLLALTFDDGPSFNGNTEQVLDMLQRKQVKATFFVTGYGHDAFNLTYDSRKQALLRRMQEEGHQIASHTFTHESLKANRSYEEIVTDISNLANAVRDIVGLNLTLLRPPYGDYNETVVNLIEKEFGYEVIMWNIDTMDWSNRADIDASFEAYLEAMENASATRDSFIVLHHDPIVRGAELAERAIDFVRSKGFQLVTVGECIGID